MITVWWGTDLKSFIFFNINWIIALDHFEYSNLISCFFFTRSTNMATKLTLKIIILDLIKWLSSRFHVFRIVVIVCLIQDKVRSSVISLIKPGTKKIKFCLFEEGMPIIYYSLFWFFLIDIKRFIIYFDLISYLLSNKYHKKSIYFS